MTRIPVPMDPSRIARELADIKRELAAIRGQRRLRSATISEGSLSIKGGGNLYVVDEFGDIQARVGPSPDGGGTVETRHANGVPSFFAGHMTFGGQSVGRGLLVQGDGGEDLLAISPETTGGPPTVRLHDSQGARAFSTDDGGSGLLDRPYLDTAVYSANSNGTWIKADNTTEEILWRTRLWITHPYLNVQAFAAMSAAASSWTLRLRTGGLAGDQLGSNVVVNSTTATFYSFGDLDITGLGAAYSFVQLNLTVQRTAGTGTCTVIPYGVTRKGTP